MIDEARGDAAWIADIHDALRDLRSRTDLGWAALARDETAQRVVRYDLILIGEAVGNVSKRTQRANPFVPWLGLYKFRVDLTHHYASVEWDEVRGFILRKLAGLERKLRRVRIAPREIE